MELLYYLTVPAIASVVYGGLAILKVLTRDNLKVKKFLPVIAGSLGAILGLVIFLALPELMSTGSVFVALFKGASSGLAATGSHQILKQLSKHRDNKEGEGGKETGAENGDSVG